MRSSSGTWGCEEGRYERRGRAEAETGGIAPGEDA